MDANEARRQIQRAIYRQQSASRPAWSHRDILRKLFPLRPPPAPGMVAEWDPWSLCFLVPACALTPVWVFITAIGLAVLAVGTTRPLFCMMTVIVLNVAMYGLVRGTLRFWHRYACRNCRSRVHPQAHQCPHCQATLL